MILEASWASTWGLLGLQKQMKIMKNRENQAFPRGGQVFIDFSSILDFNFHPRKIQNHCFSIGKTTFLKKTPSQVDLHFGGQLGAKLEAYWPQKPTKIPKKNDFKRHPKTLIFASILPRFGTQLGGQVGAMLATNFASRRPKTPKNASRTPPRQPLTCFEASRGPKTPPRAPKRPQEAHVGCILGGFWTPCWLHS